MKTYETLSDARLPAASTEKIVDGANRVRKASNRHAIGEFRKTGTVSRFGSDLSGRLTIRNPPRRPRGILSF